MRPLTIVGIGIVLVAFYLAFFVSIFVALILGFMGMVMMSLKNGKATVQNPQDSAKPIPIVQDETIVQKEGIEISRLDKLQERTILVVAFLGAAAFAGLVLILGNPNFILNATGEGGEGYLQEVSFILVFVSGISGITVLISFLSSAIELTSKGARNVYYLTLMLTILVFGGFEVGLTFIFNAVNLGLAVFSNTILVIIAAIAFWVVFSSRKTK